MSTLFPDHAPPAADRADAETIRLLEGYGYKREKVRTWTRERALSVLHGRQKEDGITVRRAAAAAATQEPAPPRGRPSRLEREVAAAAVEQALAASPDETTQAVCYTVYCLTDDELRDLAGQLVRVFRRPVTKEEVTP